MLKTTVCSLAALPLALLATTVAAETSAPAGASVSYALPHAFEGYSTPEITQCTTVGALKRECVVPAMTAGHYVIVADGSATSTGAGATQSLAILINGQGCASANSTTFTGQKAIPAVVCQVTFLTDQALSVTALFAVKEATPDPAGPKLVVKRLPWNGTLDVKGGILPPRPAPAAAESKKP